ncbi:MAG: hypothetical protein IT280_12630 [Ignavibacteria bacterium]|nr:hypothetical protein [Ignavibacteria bacterium]
MKKQRDVKFIIYQALYIFVVCVVAIKGANLDLSQVIEDDGKPKVILTPEEMDSIKKLLEKAIIVDTNRFALVDKDLLKDNEKMKELVRQTMVSNTSFVSSSPVVETTPIVEKNEKIEKIDPTTEQKIENEIVLGDIELYQYHVNSVSNRGNNPIVVAGVTIPAHSTKQVQLGGESTVTISAGDKSKTVNVKDNSKPKINIQRVSSMGEDARASDLQRSIGFRVTISDDFPEQLDVKFNGPVTIENKGNGVYDVKMNAFGSKSAFDNFIDNKDAPYNVGFTVSVSDRLSGHKITGQQSFQFGEW